MRVQVDFGSGRPVLQLALPQSVDEATCEVKYSKRKQLLTFKARVLPGCGAAAVQASCAQEEASSKHDPCVQAPQVDENDCGACNTAGRQSKPDQKESKDDERNKKSSAPVHDHQPPADSVRTHHTASDCQCVQMPASCS